MWGSGGGPDKTILLGTCRSDPARFAVTVCYIRDARDPAFGIEERPERSKIDYAEVLEKHSFDVRIWRSLRDIMRDRRIDIVHAHDYKTDLFAWLLSKRERVIPIATAHGWAGHSWKERRIYYPLDRQILRLYPRVIAVSSDIKRMLIAAGVRESSVLVVPNGIDQKSNRREPGLAEIARRELGIEPGQTAIGAIGRLEAEKNYPLLIAAFSELLARHESAVLLVAGDGSLKNEIQAQSRNLGISNQCRFLGQVADVRRLHLALDIFVMCSDNEGSPNAVLEAMALETPVIATDVGGVADMVRPSVDGLVIPRQDKQALVEAMLEIIANPSAARWRVENARMHVKEEFTFDARMRRIERIYEDVMSGADA